MIAMKKQSLFNGFFDPSTHVKEYRLPKGKHYTDFITKGDMDLKDFVENNRTYILSGGIGTGKTTLIKYLPELTNRPIIYFCHRTRLKKQQEIAFKGKNATVFTYQGILMKEGELEKLEIYLNPIFVFDEYHYFNDDSYNGITDEFIEKVIKKYQNAPKIFISAKAETTEDMLFDKGIFDEETIKYFIPNNYDHIILSHYYTSNTSRNRQILTLIKNGGKCILFCMRLKDVKKAYDYFNQLGINVAIKISSIEKKEEDFDNKAKFELWQEVYKLSEECEILLETIEDGSIKLNSDLLVCTSVLDAGISIKDNDVKGVFIESRDANSMYQELGRVRHNEHQTKFELYVRVLLEQQLQYIYNQTQLDLKESDLSETQELKKQEVIEHLDWINYKRKDNEQLQEQREKELLEAIKQHNLSDEQVNKALKSCKRFAYELRSNPNTQAYLEWLINKVFEFDVKNDWRLRLFKRLDNTNEDDKVAEVKDYFDILPDDKVDKDVLLEIINRGMTDPHQQVKSISKVNKWLKQNNINIELKSKVIKQDKKTIRIWMI